MRPTGQERSANRMLDALRRNVVNLQLFAGEGGDPNNPGGEGAPKGGSSGDPGGEGGPDTSRDLKALKEELQSVRRESAKYRTENKLLQEKFARLEKLEEGMKTALGLEKTEDPDTAMKAISELKHEIATERMQNVFQKVAIKAGADIDLTWNFLKGSNSVKPEMTEAEMEKLIDDTIKAYPKLKAEQKPPRSGADFGKGKPGEKMDMNDILRRSVRR